MTPTARQALDMALLGMAEARTHPRCAEPGDTHLWVSDSREDRARAALLCTGCPISTECRDSADEEGEAWSVRAGHDYRPPSPSRKKKDAA